MTTEKKRQVKCRVYDCIYYSEQTSNTLDGPVKEVFCSSPNWFLIELPDAGCPSYQLDWKKRTQLTPETISHPAEKEKELFESTTAPVSPQGKPATQSKQKTNADREKKSELKKVNAKNVQPDFAPPPLPPEQHERSKPFGTMKTFTPPEEIVRQFIESWNKQDFTSEYNCLSHTLPLPPLGDYILSRKSIYQALADQIGKGSPAQQFAEIKRIEFQSGSVYVECLRKDVLGKDTKEYLQEFLLRREESDWKIISVNSKRIRTP